MTEATPRYDVFISHSRADAGWVRDWLLPRLEGAGLRVCVDFRDFDLGRPSLVNMERAVDASRHTLLVLTPALVASEWAEFEALLTQTPDPAGRHRRLIPLLLHPCQPPDRIAMLTCADFTRAEAWERELPRVVAAIRDELRLPELGPKLGRLLEPASLTLHTVRAPVADFTGRDAEIAALLAHLSGDGAAALISGIRGMGGVGKTELALVLAHWLAPRYPDAQLMFELQPGGQPLSAEAVLAAVLHTFQPEAQLPDALAELQTRYCQALANKRGLLLLDNAANADQVRPLLPPPAGWVVLVTSRRRFPLPAGQMHDLDVLPESDAVTLLERMLRDGGRDDLSPCRGGATPSSLAGKRNEGVRSLARLCGCLPLALRMAAGYLTTYADWSLDDYLAELERGRLKYLAVEGELSVETILRLSVDALAREDATLARRWHELAVFSSPFDRAAAAAVWDIPESDARTALSALLSRTLLEYNRPTDTYTFHDLLRECALTSSLLGSSEGQRVRFHHATHYLAVGTQADALYLQGGDQITEALRRFDVAWPHLQAAWEWLKTQGDEVALRWLSDFPDVIAYLLDLRLTPFRRIPILKTALSAARRLSDSNAEGGHLGNLGLAYADLGDATHAIGFYERALAIARELGDRRIEGNWLGNLGLAYAALGDAVRAIGYHEQALAIAREISDRRGEGNALGNLGIAYAMLGDARRAIGFHEQALVIAREIGGRSLEGTALGNLGHAYAALGDARRAIGFYEQALVIAHELSDRREEGTALNNLGIAYATLGDTRRAIIYYEQALAIAREISDRRGEGNAMGNLGIAHRNLGDAARAIEFHEQWLEITREIGDRRGQGNALVNLGNAYTDLRDAVRAIGCYEQMLAIVREIGDQNGEAIGACDLGLAYERQGDYTRAVELMQITVNFERSIGHAEAEKDACKLEEVKRKAQNAPIIR